MNNSQANDESNDSITVEKSMVEIIVFNKPFYKRKNFCYFIIFLIVIIIVIIILCILIFGKKSDKKEKEKNQKLIITINANNDNEKINFLGNNFDEMELKNNINKFLIDDKNFKFSKSHIFQKGKHKITIDFKNNIYNLSYMFENCDQIEEIQFINFKTDKVTYMNNMFENCFSLIKLELSSFMTNKIIDMSKMFYNCINLIDLNIDSFNIDYVKKSECMFYNCESLQKEKFKDFKFYNKNDIYKCSLDSYDIKIY